MTTTPRTAWLVPAGLIALSLVPVLAGAVRLGEIASGAATPDNARFLAAPVPVVLHIVSAAVFCVLGAFQFSATIRSRHRQWHRAAGRVLVPCGLVAAVSGLWMTQFYPSVEFDGVALYWIRIAAGAGMAASIAVSFAAIRQRDIVRHRAWMMRGYALGLGAGTQVLTHLPWLLFPAVRGELSRTVFMAAGWAINLAVVEWILRRRSVPAGTG